MTSTTPGRMRLVSLVLLAFVALVWALGFVSVAHRQQAISRVGTKVEPVVVSSETLETLYSGADASAANSFLAGGIEPADQRAHYLADLRQAQDQLAELALGGTSTTATDSIRTMAEATATYSGLVETARADNRLGFPVGVGYLRRATELMHGSVIPAAEALHQQSLRRLDTGYHAASGGAALLEVLGASLVLLAALVAAQVFLCRRTRRILNVGLVTATALSVVLIGWTLLSMLGEASQVSAARDRSNALNAVADVTVTAFRANSDQSLALVARGNGVLQYQDFDAAVAQLGGLASGSGLLGDAARHADTPEERAQLAGARRDLTDYVAVHAMIQSLDTTGSSAEAFTMALAGGTGSSRDAFGRLDVSLQQTRVLLQGQFHARITSAGRRLAGVAIGISMGFVLVALLVLYGFQQRIREYR